MICSRRDTALVLFGLRRFSAGPKPGRDGFSDELGRGYVEDATERVSVKTTKHDVRSSPVDK